PSALRQQTFYPESLRMRVDVLPRERLAAAFQRSLANRAGTQSRRSNGNGYCPKKRRSLAKTPGAPRTQCLRSFSWRLCVLARGRTSMAPQVSPSPIRTCRRVEARGRVERQWLLPEEKAISRQDARRAKNTMP